MGSRNAYAVAITEDNLRGVIRSEAGPSFDLEWALNWLMDHGEGWFLRDEESSFDCQFFDSDIFEDFYKFASADVNSLFRQVFRL